MGNNRLKELFELVKQDITDTENRFQTGICKSINKLQIQNKMSYIEEAHLKGYLKQNKPTKDNQYAEFTKNKYWLNDSYWWYVIEDVPQTKQIRIDFLTKLIANIK